MLLSFYWFLFCYNILEISITRELKGYYVFRFQIYAQFYLAWENMAEIRVQLFIILYYNDNFSVWCILALSVIYYISFIKLILFRVKFKCLINCFKKYWHEFLCWFFWIIKCLFLSHFIELELHCIVKWHFLLHLTIGSFIFYFMNTKELPKD